MKKWKEEFLKSIETIGQIASEALVFVFIALVAFGLGHLVHWMEAHHAGIVAIYVLKFGEYSALVMDVYALLKRMWTHLTHK